MGSGERETLHRHLAIYPLEKFLYGAPNPEPRRLLSFLFLHSGRLFLKLSSGNSLEAGPVVVVCAPEVIRDIRSDTTTKGTCIVVDPVITSNLLSPFLEATGAEGFLPSTGSSVFPMSRKDAEYAVDILELLEDEIREKQAGWRESALLRLGLLIVQLSRSALQSTDSPDTRISVEDLPRYVEEHYSDDFSLDDLANRCRVTPGQLSRGFKQLTGQPLFSFINDIRIEKACGLLKRTRMTVLEISFAVGYNNVSFFNRYFRKLMGTAPSEYRKTAQR